MTASSSSSSSSTPLLAEANYGSVMARGECATRTRVYPTRWYILALFSLLGLFQGMIWNTFGPISESVLAVFCPQWTEATLALLGNWGNIMYIVPIVPVIWFFEAKGLRASILLTGLLMSAGTLLRCLPLRTDMFTIMSHLCAILNGVAGVVVFSVPSAVSSAWFPPAERTTATAVGILFNNLGNALSFLAGPAVVPGTRRHAAANTTQGILSGDDFEIVYEANAGLASFRYAPPPPIRSYGQDSPMCPLVDEDEKALIALRLSYLMYGVFALVAALTAAILCYFPSKPKLPPSKSSAVERMEFLPGLRAMCCNRSALLMTASFSLFNGLIASWYSVMNITFSGLPIGEADDADRIIGYIGISTIIANGIATFVVSRVVDRIRGGMKRILLSIMVAAVACWVWLGLICLGAIPFSLAQLFAATISSSCLTYSAGPIFFEFTAELVYPVPEGIVGGFLTTFYNGVGMVFLFLFYIPALSLDPGWIPYAFMASTLASVPLVMLVKEEYNRSRVDQSFGSSTSSSEYNQSSYEEI